MSCSRNDMNSRVLIFKTISLSIFFIKKGAKVVKIARFECDSCVSFALDTTIFVREIPQRPKARKHGYREDIGTYWKHQGLSRFSGLVLGLLRRKVTRKIFRKVF